MSGVWRITVESWISENADWYGRRVYVIDGSEVHSLPAALHEVVARGAGDWLDERYYQNGSGTAPEPNYPPPRGEHDWPAELDGEASCLSCGLPYRQWDDEDPGCPSG